jgi:hypothetical protein
MHFVDISHTQQAAAVNVTTTLGPMQTSPKGQAMYFVNTGTFSINGQVECLREPATSERRQVGNKSYM